MGVTREPAVEVADLCKSYGEVTAIKDVSLTIESGEYFVLLGPSGGGKTTLLRLIGGFIKPTKGRILLHGRDVSDLPPDRRRTSMVFQSYALFPHMTVAKNVGYGLRLRKLPQKVIDERVESMLSMVGLAGYGARMPYELSGGQQQRVQLARALVLESDILLLDEPLAALDAKLRKDMCFELKHLQEKVGITFVHVTHNQDEAMAVADRIAIIADGELIEAGRARDIYREPLRRFTADFIGENNILDGTVADNRDGMVVVDVGFGKVSVNERSRSGNLQIGMPASFSVRSERMHLLGRDERHDGRYQVLPAKYQEEIYLGLVTRHRVALPDGRELNVRAISDAEEASHFELGEDVFVGWRTEDGKLHFS